MKHVLVVEDSPLVLKILAHLFRQEPDLEPVFCATAGETEVLLDSADAFFAAVVDLNLPDAPNGEVVDIVLAKGVPCIVLTGSYDENSREVLLHKGVVDYVIKESLFSYEYVIRLLHRLSSNRDVKVLIAEDSTVTRAVIREALAPQLYRIYEASDGQEALDMIAEHPDINLLIVDFNMPRVNGFELVKTLRHKLKRHDIIIVGLSADGKSSVSTRFIKHGADDYIRKPFYPEELQCRLTRCLERKELVQALERVANFDDLTGLANRRHFYDAAEHILQQAQRDHQQIAVAVLDIDHFKQINDQYGHASGDRALALFGQALQAEFPGVLCSRLGGEEFAVLVAGWDAPTLGQRLQHLLSTLPQLRYADASAPAISFSAGVDARAPTNLDQHLHCADELLYRAKAEGRALVLWE